ncbi:hypothetical protein GCM10027432_27010 [Lysobacter fragariae]
MDLARAGNRAGDVGRQLFGLLEELAAFIKRGNRVHLFRPVSLRGKAARGSAAKPSALRRVGLNGSRKLIAARTKRRRGTDRGRSAKLPYGGLNRIRFEGSVSTTAGEPAGYPRFGEHFTTHGAARPEIVAIPGWPGAIRSQSGPP